MEVSVVAQGWYRDPYLVHEDRYFSAGEPTKLVRDGGIEDYDPPPDGPPKAQLLGPERDDIREQQHGAWQAEDAAERERDERESDERERDERESDERERDERDRDERNAWRHCPHCLLYTSDADHVCVTYDGPPCGTCGEPTALFTVGAPGYGTGRTCRNGHGEHLTRAGIYTPEQNR
jgi:hypothetical protein